MSVTAAATIGRSPIRTCGSPPPLTGGRSASSSPGRSGVSSSTSSRLTAIRTGRRVSSSPSGGRAARVASACATVVPSLNSASIASAPARSRSWAKRRIRTIMAGPAYPSADGGLPQRRCYRRLMAARTQLLDGHGRAISDLRLSVTDRCGFRCRYCMPAEGMRWLDSDDLLSFEEIERLVRVLVEMGIRDVRLTGGEPLVRREPGAPGGNALGDSRPPRAGPDDQRLRARTPGAGARGGRHQPLQRLGRLAPARALQ